MCVQGANQGWCEPTNFCSFPDLECDSGRRYGPAAPKGLADLCVPVDEAGTGTGGGTGGGSDDGSTLPVDDATDGRDAMTDAGETDDPNDDANDDASDDATTDPTGSDTGSSACEVVDDFEDGTIDTAWEVFEDPDITTAETDGVLRFTVPSGGGERYGGVYGELMDLRGWVLTAELAPIGSELDDATELWLSAGTEDCSLEVGIAGLSVSGYSYLDQFFDDEVDPDETLRVRLRIEPDEFVWWEVERDGRWVTVYAEDSPCDMGEATIALFAANGGFVQQEVTRAVEHVEGCSNPSP